MMEHPNYDEFWQARNIRPHLKNIKPAVMTVGGWFDAEDLFGAINTYKSVEKQSPGAYNMLVMGPWFHGGWSRCDGDALGNVSIRLEDRGLLSREHRASVFQLLSERQRRVETTGSICVRNRIEQVEDL